jgi:DNA-binding transcriptional ArsR family regulator
LSECGLVAAEQQGRFVYYRLGNKRIQAILGLADELLAEIGRRIFACTNYRGTARGKAASSSSRRKVA